MLQLAGRMGRAKPSAIMAGCREGQALKAEGRDIISFSIGVPNFLPGEHVYEAAREALVKDSGQYGTNRGPDELLDAFLKHLAKTASRATPGPTSPPASAPSTCCTTSPKRCSTKATEVFPTPYWTSYLDIAEILNAKITCCRARRPELQADARAARRRAGDEAEGVPVQQPVESDRHGLHDGRIVALADVLVRHPDTWVLTDDIYNRMLFDGLEYHNFVQARPELRERVIFIDSLSKTYGMPGWRVGFMAGPERSRRRSSTLNSNHITNIPEIVTAAAVAALSGPQDVPKAQVRGVPGQARPGDGGAGAIPGVICPRPQGAFYAFPDISVAFGKTHAPAARRSATTSSSAMRCWKPRASPACRVRPSASRARCASATPARRRSCPGLQRFQEFFAELDLREGGGHLAIARAA